MKPAPVRGTATSCGWTLDPASGRRVHQLSRGALTSLLTGAAEHSDRLRLRQQADTTPRMALAQKRRGYIYILSSPNCPSIKIGKTENLPPHRLRQINAQSPYREHGPWRIVDVVRVEDVTAVETRIWLSAVGETPRLRGRRSSSISRSLTPRHLLRTVPRSEELYAYPKLERCFFNVQLVEYLSAIYQTVGLSNFLGDQGAWVLSLFTSTAGGRYFLVHRPS